MGTSAAWVTALMRGLMASVTGDSSVVEELYTDDVQAWSPVMSVSSAVELAIELEDRGEAFAEIELSFAALDVEGDAACVEWTMTATREGRPLTLHGVTVAEFAGERICSFRQYWDEAEVLAQVGAPPDD